MTVRVLISTFNGEKYIAEQLNSLLAQTYAALFIEVRDDGSTDRTLEVLKRFEHAYPSKIKVIEGSNVGFVASFFELLNKSGPADFYAFCDQDDFWEPQKLQLACNKLSVLGNAPGMHVSRFELVDESLNHLGYSVQPRELSFRASLAESRVLGCTVVLNASSKRLVISRPTVSAISHDWWCYLVVSALGTIINDSDVLVRYRQHQKNVFGRGTSRLERFRNRLKNAKKKGFTPWSKQAIAFFELFRDQLDPNKQQTLELVSRGQTSWFARFRLVCSTRIYRESFFDSLMIRALILLKLFW